MNKPWASLPNAHHIDWVLKSVKENRQLWIQEVWGVVCSAAWSMGMDAVWSAARNAARNMARDESHDAAHDAALEAAARTVVLALVAYDDCDQYLNMGYEKLLMYAKLSEKPQAIMLLPMVYVKEKLNDRMVTLT